jgi:hypothetical protein
MDDKQLDRCLRSIGKKCFVRYFKQFSDTRIQDYQIIDTLMKNEGYTETGCRTRVSQSRRIIREGRAKDALREIIASERLSESVRQEAADLVNSV